MKVTFWGTRGSIPAPGPGTVRVGGNTTCIDVLTGDGHRIIIDAGTGMRPLGLDLVGQADLLPMTLLLTHSHWDHLAGFTFFTPAYHPDHRMTVYGNQMALEVLRRDIFERRDNRYYPVNMDHFRAKIEIIEELPQPLRVGGVTVRAIGLNHPGGGYGFRLDQGGSSFAFITDNELGKQYPNGSTPGEMAQFCNGVELLVHDAQYLPGEIASRRGWGHSTYAEVADLAHHAGVKRVHLTHHDPERDDNACESLLEEARRYISARGYYLECDLAVEGAYVEL